MFINALSKHILIFNWGLKSLTYETGSTIFTSHDTFQSQEKVMLRPGISHGVGKIIIEKVGNV